MDFTDAETGEFQDYFEQIIGSTGLVNLDYTNLIMIVVGLVFIYLAIVKDYEPLLLLPIGFGMLIGNIPLPLQLFNNISIYMIDPITHQYAFNTTANSVLGIIYSLITSGVLPPLIFLGIGAMTDFTTLLSNPKTVLLGAAAQIGVFATFLGALWLGFNPQAAASIGIIGGADGPTAIFLTSKLAPSLIGPIAIAAYSYMGLIPIIQPPIMRLLTTRKERVIRMKPGRKVSKREKIIFPIIAFLVTTMIAPGAIPLLGMLFFGNLLKESGVTARLAKTAANALIDIATILLGLGVGASTTAQVFLNTKSILIFVLGCLAFIVASAFGILFAKFMNLFLSKENKINPLIGSAGVSAVPDAARVSELIGRRYDPNNHLLMHAMGPNVAGVIGSGIAAGILLGIF
ncbi:MAG TPA: sodium ion-translocating decarboxylase subunit beta [Acidobacteriota bacterium]|nr:sodium ion-translocating decarboxylase subunit beta [Acidobacteriota bacterium]